MYTNWVCHPTSGRFYLDASFLFVGSAGYQLGYYLVYPAIAMFLFAFLLNEVRAR
jgi:hypothetical protein